MTKFNREYTVKGFNFSCEVEVSPSEEEVFLISAIDEYDAEVLTGTDLWYTLQDHADADLFDLLQNIQEFRDDAIFDEMRDREL